MHKKDMYKVICADKSYGLAIIEMARLTEKGFVEHLSNHNVYQKMSEKKRQSTIKRCGAISRLLC